MKVDPPLENTLTACKFIPHQGPWLPLIFTLTFTILLIGHCCWQHNPIISMVLTLNLIKYTHLTHHWSSPALRDWHPCICCVVINFSIAVMFLLIALDKRRNPVQGLPTIRELCSRLLPPCSPILDSKCTLKIWDQFSVMCNLH